MPIYQYRCEQCACEFDVRKSFTEESDHVTCPGCGKKANRIFSAPGIIFKGSGFYVTDSKSNSTLASAESSQEKPKQNAGAAKAGRSNEIPS